jgi:hypothetical protein
MNDATSANEYSPATKVLANHPEYWDFWNSIPLNSRARRLLRLAILRDLRHSLHAERSVLLAEGRPERCRMIDGYEALLEILRSSPLLAGFEGELSALLNANRHFIESQGPSRSEPGLPEAIFNFIDRKKIERGDRHWEYTMTNEALRQGWHLWQMSAWVDIQKAEEWNRQLSKKLWPEGIVLYVESGEITSTEIKTGWKGSWLILLSPSYTPNFSAVGSSSMTPAGTSGGPIGVDRDRERKGKLELHPEKWPGYLGKAPQWKLLFPASGQTGGKTTGRHHS